LVVGGGGVQTESQSLGSMCWSSSSSMFAW
jgi:hypothetical protein